MLLKIVNDKGDKNEIGDRKMQWSMDLLAYLVRDDIINLGKRKQKNYPEPSVK